MRIQEGRIISENPLRILGVYSDTPKKEIVANLGKLRAFAKTGKALSFDSDFTSLLGPVNRTLETIEKANNDISLPKDKLQAGMFWFMQHTDNDKLAMESLKAGNADEAMTIIQKKGNYSGVVNMAVLALVLKRWDIALYSYAYLLESPLRRGALIKAFTDTEDYFSEDDLVDFISTKLIQDFPSAHWVEQLQHENVELGEKTYPFKSRFEGSKLLNKIVSECTDSIKKSIDKVLDKASSVSRNDARANLSMAAFVEEKCKPLLKELRFALGKDHVTYIEYADNISNQILDNCIDYYTHDANNENRASSVMKYTRYAYRTAESKTTKERAKKNLDILNEVRENTIPASIREEYDNIDRQVTYFKANESKIDYCDSLSTIIPYCCSQIQAIEAKLGGNNKHYLAISADFGLFADQAIIKHVNSFLSSIGFKNSVTLSLYNLRAAHKCLKWANSMYRNLDVITFTDNLSADSPVRRYLNNRSYVEKLFIRFEKEFNEHPLNKTVIPFSSTRINSKSGANKEINQNRSSQVTSPRANSDLQGNDNSAKYAFGGFSLIVIVVLLIVWGTNNAGSSKDIVQNETTYKEQAATSDAVSDFSSSTNSDYSTDDYTSNEMESTSSYSSDDNQQTVEQIEEPVNIVHLNTGDRPYQGTYGRGNYDSNTQNSLLIRNGSCTDAVVFLEKTNGKKIRHVFITRGENFTMTNVPGGQYIIKVMQGTDWNTEKDNGAGNPKGGFMYSCSMSKSESYDAFDFPYPSSGQYGQFEVTLYKVQNGNMQTESINENDLF
jgi:hypothetical protein